MLTTAYSLDKSTEIFPTKGIHGFCIDCGEEVISKCGEFVSDHFAHKSKTNCGNSLHDNKSDWHRQWQHTIIPAIPGENVEVTILNDYSFKRADMISQAKDVIEFQHSPLSLTERLEREAHYQKMIWVVHIDKFNSKTWKHKTSTRIFFNGDNDRIFWETNIRYFNFYLGYSTLKCHMIKSKFISLVINNPQYCSYVFNTIERRSLKKEEALNEIYFKHGDTIGCTSPIYKYTKEQLWSLNPPPKSMFYSAWFYIIQQFVAIEEYHKQIECARIERENRIWYGLLPKIYLQIQIPTTLLFPSKDLKEKEIKEQRRIRDPALLLSLLKSKIDKEEIISITEKNDWITVTEQMISVTNRERRETLLKLQHEARQLKLEQESLILKQINTEINNNVIQHLDKVTQERIQIDLIRLKGNNKYAAQSAHERLKRLNIVHEYTEESK